MKVRVYGSTDIYTFSLYDKALGYDKIFEFLETNCDFVAEKFIYHEDDGLYECEQQVFDKWQYIIDSQQLLSSRINNLKIEHGDIIVDEVINRAIFHCIEDEVDAINYELDRVFNET